ncbi:hypothetical protein [Hydrogenimonas sp. SS33]|uniref:hypothetical protein n=1 Tax=Hydrogenimonas leucolamina TaxID=2954236 RepID=UPI00336BD35A
MDEKRLKKYKETRYKRELERFLNRCVAFAQQERGTREDFDTLVDRIEAKLQEVEKVPLYNDYYGRLERFVEMVGGLRRGEEEADGVKAQIQHEANRIRKSRRIKSYNRKRKNGGFEEGF